MSHKLIAFDLDGTLLRPDKTISTRTLSAIKELEANGHTPIISTGRSKFLIGSILKQSGITNYIVCNGGAAYLDEKPIWNFPISKATLALLTLYLNNIRADIAFTGLHAMHLITMNDRPVVKKAMQAIGGDLPTIDTNFLMSKDIYQALAFVDSEQERLLRNSFPDLNITRFTDHCVDINPHGVTKAKTLLRVARTLDIAPSDIIAFGDGDNDIEMLKSVGTGVAMGNAAKKVKENADFVTCTNIDDGVVEGLEKLAVI